MKFSRLTAAALLAVGLTLMLAPGGCGPKTESGMPEPSDNSGPEVTYTVLAEELENPDGKAVYVCPMEEHKDQVSLDPDARCKLCNMKLVPLEEAEKVWAAERE